MTGLPIDTVLAAVQEHAVRSWRVFTQERNLVARLHGWKAGTAPDGRPSLSAEVVGRGAERALHLFASQHHLTLAQPDDLRPVFDYSTPGRTSCVWRSSGVWVEFWHPDPMTSPTDPVSAPSARPAVPVLGRLGARLPFTRPKKENAA